MSENQAMESDEIKENGVLWMSPGGPRFPRDHTATRVLLNGEGSIRDEVPEAVLEAFPSAFESMCQNPFEGMIDEICPVIKEDSSLEINFNESRKKVVLLSNPYRIPDEMTYYAPNPTVHTTTGRVVVMGGTSSAVSKAIVQTIIAMADRMIGTMVEPTPLASLNFWQRSWYPIEWRWTDLHAKLSWEGSMDKFKRQQQRQKSLFKHHEEKRIKKGRSHAKQRHKSVARRG